VKGLIYVGLALAVMGLGFWAYRENYATQASLKEVREVSAEIAAMQARLDRLNAEWAYLNRPDRLRDLVELNFQRLELLPMRPESFASVEDIPTPTETMGTVASSFIVSSETSGTEEPL
jgi:hypothetical protein